MKKEEPQHPFVVLAEHIRRMNCDGFEAVHFAPDRCQPGVMRIWPIWMRIGLITVDPDIIAANDGALT